MSGIQEVILKQQRQLGQKPVFIVSEHDTALDYFSLLFSNHLLPKGNAYKERTLLAHDNYYNTPYLNHIIRTDWAKYNSEELESILMLHLEEGHDTNRLYGLTLNIETYQKLHSSTFIQNGIVVFVYAEFKNNLDRKSSFNPSKLVEQLQHEKSIVYINHKLAYSYPEELIKTFSELLGADAFNVEAIRPLQFNVLDWSSYSPFYNKVCQEKDFISLRHLNCNSLAIILLLSEPISVQILTGFLSSIFLSRSKNIDLILLCQDVQLSLKELPPLIQDSFKLQLLVANENLSFQLNQLIHHIDSEWILIDNLYLKPELKLWSAMNTSDYSMCFGKLGRSKQEIDIKLSDLLTGEKPECNLVLKRIEAINIGGFDERIPTQKNLWDLAIRLWQSTKGKTLVYNTELMINQKQILNQNDTAINEYIIKKHEPIFLHCINEVILSINEDIGLSQSEIVTLHQTVNSLNLVLSHSKDELKSLQSLNSELQHRIQYLESTWYQRAILKIRRIKKIFFKKKSPGSGTLKRIWLAFRFLLSKSGIGILRKIAANFTKHLFLFIEKRPVEIVYKDLKKSEGVDNYQSWISKKLDKNRLNEEYENEVKEIAISPLISIIMPVYNPPLKYLKEAIESVLDQNYTNWQLCIADDHSPNEKVRKLLKSYAVKDKRIQVVYKSTNDHISATSNVALTLAKGEYILFMDHDDLLTQHCLWEVVKAIHTNQLPDIIYSDEDKFDEHQIHQSAYFKPDWSPDHLLAKNYIGHVCVIRKELIDKIGGFRIGYEGSQDYDLLLRATEIANGIVHIPKVLYHWRIHQLSAAAGEDVKPYAYIAAKKALEDTLSRRGLSGKVRYLSGLRGYRIDFDVQKEDKVSIIIPTKDQTELLKNAIDSILEKTSYSNYEILILNNNSTTHELDKFIKEYTTKFSSRVKAIDAHFPFNFSKLMNLGVKETSGSYILFLNNDIEIIESEWLTHMVAFAQQKHIGAVGARLLYPDDTVQHAGVIVGLGGVAGHAFTGQYRDEPGYFNLIQTVNNFSAVTAACLLCRREVFDEVHGMDEQFEVEYNDVDFCLKMMEAGYYNVYVPQVELYHFESATRGHPHQSKPSYERHLKEMELFKLKWQNIIDRDPYYNPNLHLGYHDFTMDFSA